MKPYDLKSMSVDELLSLHEFVSSALCRGIPTETARLNQQLRQFGLGAVPHEFKKMSPAEPSETWAGRGKRPRWLTAQLKSGSTIFGSISDGVTQATECAFFFCGLPAAIGPVLLS